MWMPARAGRLRPADQPDRLERLARGQRHQPDVRPGDARDRVEVHPQLVGMIEVLGPDRVRVEVDAAEVGDPGEPGRVVDDDLVGGPPGREGQGGGPDELGQVLGRPLLEERLPGGAVHEPLQRHRPTTGAAQRPVRDGQVVLHEVELGVTRLREVDLPRIGDRDLVPVDPEDLLLRSHVDTIPSTAVGGPVDDAAHDRSPISLGTRMLNQSEPACLVIADITGYTSYLAGVELDHAQDILADLIDTVVGSLRPTFRLAKLEGDAAFTYVITESIDASALMDTVERTYFAFRRRLRDIGQASTCDCNACMRMPTLDLKLLAHHGTILRQRVAGREELVGSPVIVAHRLLKNEVTETTGFRAYALYTEDCLRAAGVR